MDISKLRERLAKLNKKTNKLDDLWRPSDEHQIRLFQDPNGEEPFRELYFHYDIGDSGPILCPRDNFNKQCAICEFADALKSWTTPEGVNKVDSERKSDFEIFKKIQSKARVFIPIIERANSSKNIQEPVSAKWWSMTPNQAQSIVELCIDEDRLEELGIDKDDTEKALNVVLSRKKAYDLMISYAKPGEKGNDKKFTQITIKGKIKPSNFARNKEEEDRLLSTAKKLSELYPEVESNDVEIALNKFLSKQSKESESEDVGDNEAKYNGGEEKEIAKTSGTTSIDEVFKNLLDD